MKITYLFLFLGIFACVRKQSTNISNKKKYRQLDDPTKSYKVYKIDSINLFYLIYARRGNSIYKIVSKKVSKLNCDNSINIGKNYDFKLHSQSYNPETGKQDELPENSLLVNCFYYDSITTICVERDSITDLFYAENLKGLCYKVFEK
jgi:hypothetical protein